MNRSPVLALLAASACSTTTIAVPFAMRPAADQPATPRIVVLPVACWDGDASWWPTADEAAFRPKSPCTPELVANLQVQARTSLRAGGYELVDAAAPPTVEAFEALGSDDRHRAIDDLHADGVVSVRIMPWKFNGSGHTDQAASEYFANAGRVTFVLSTRAAAFARVGTCKAKFWNGSIQAFMQRTELESLTTAETCAAKAFVGVP